MGDLCMADADFCLLPLEMNGFVFQPLVVRRTEITRYPPDINNTRLSGAHFFKSKPRFILDWQVITIGFRNPTSSSPDPCSHGGAL